MEDLVLLTREQVEEIERRGIPLEGFVPSQLNKLNDPSRDAHEQEDTTKHKKKSKKHHKKKSKKKHRRHRDGDSRSKTSSSTSSKASTSSNDSEISERRHKKTSKKKKSRRHHHGRSSSSSTSSNEREHVDDEESKKQEKLLLNKSLREAAGLGWMTQPTKTTTSSTNDTKIPVSNKKPQQDEFGRDIMDSATFSKEDSEFEPEKKSNIVDKSFKDESKDPLSLNNPNFPKHLCIAIGKYSFLMLPPRSSSFGTFHCWIVPINPTPSLRDCEDIATLKEIDRFRQSIIKMYSRINLVSIVMETTMASSRYRTKMECVGVEEKLGGDVLPSVFMKEISECDQEWTENPKLLEMKNKSLKQGFPPNTPYFYVEMFDSNPRTREPLIRYGHIIESTSHFRLSFGMDIIKGVMGDNNDQQTHSLRRSSSSMKESDQLRADEFQKAYQDFDWTVELDLDA